MKPPKPLHHLVEHRELYDLIRKLLQVPSVRVRAVQHMCAWARARPPDIDICVISTVFFCEMFTRVCIRRLTLRNG